MKNKPKEQRPWLERLQSHRQDCSLALEDLRELEQEYQNGVDVELLLERIKTKMESIQTEAACLYEVMCIVPLETMFSAGSSKLTEQQYCLLRAAGFPTFTAKMLGICPVDDYDVHMNCLYEDDDQIHIMNPDETPEVETVDEKTGVTTMGLNIALSPEETELRFYTPEQICFFTMYRPDVLARAQKGKSDRVHVTDAGGKAPADVNSVSPGV